MKIVCFVSMALPLEQNPATWRSIKIYNRDVHKCIPLQLFGIFSLQFFVVLRFPSTHSSLRCKASANIFLVEKFQGCMERYFRDEMHTLKDPAPFLWTKQNFGCDVLVPQFTTTIVAFFVVKTAKTEIECLIEKCMALKLSQKGLLNFRMIQQQVSQFQVHSVTVESLISVCTRCEFWSSDWLGSYSNALSGSQKQTEWSPNRIKINQHQRKRQRQQANVSRSIFNVRNCKQVNAFRQMKAGQSVQLQMSRKNLQQPEKLLKKLMV